jgi:hypothetical protein
MESSGTTIRLYSLSGQRLQTMKAEGTITTIGHSLPQGFYLLEVSREGYKGMKKLVINN